MLRLLTGVLSAKEIHIGTLPQSAALEVRAPVLSLPQSHQSFYRPELDVLRFFAFFGVFLFHAYGKHTVHNAAPWIAQANRLNCAGAFGVDLFFVLSAYLITELLLTEKRRLGRLNIKAFYLRRILRIWPLYFFALALALIPFFNPDHAFDRRYAIAFVLLAGNWSVVAWGWPGSSIVGPLWSVSVEEQFYLTWPLLVRKTATRNLAYVAIAMLVLATGTRAVLVAIHADPVSVWCSTLSRLDPIALGILVALVLHGHIPRFRLWSRLGMLFAGILPVVFIADFWHLPWPGKLTWVPYLIGFPVVAISCTLILLAILGITVRPPAILVHLGKISYGLYVYHLLGMHLAKLVLQGHLAIRQVLALLVTILLASASYAFLEKPFLKLKKRFELVGSRPV